jgi:hypothetical protein
MSCPCVTDPHIRHTDIPFITIARGICPWADTDSRCQPSLLFLQLPLIMNPILIAPLLTALSCIALYVYSQYEALRWSVSYVGPRVEATAEYFRGPFSPIVFAPGQSLSLSIQWDEQFMVWLSGATGWEYIWRVLVGQGWDHYNSSSSDSEICGTHPTTTSHSAHWKMKKERALPKGVRSDAYFILPILLQTYFILLMTLYINRYVTNQFQLPTNSLSDVIKENDITPCTVMLHSLQSKNMWYARRTL